MWVIAVVGEAPCQCLRLGGNHTTSPGRTSWPPSRWADAVLLLVGLSSRHIARDQTVDELLRVAFECGRDGADVC